MSSDEDHVPQLGDVAFLQFTSGSTADPKGAAITYGALEAHTKFGLANVFQKGAGHKKRKPVCVNWGPHWHDMGRLCSVSLFRF